jgi:ferric-dicitrate binding protein FerR (iron transport regulator)
MDCEQVLQQLSGLLDGALDQESVVLVEAHVAGCEMCRAQKESLTALDASLNRVFVAERSAADRVAAGVLARLSGADPGNGTPQPTGRPAASWQRVLGYLIAAAAGFLLAVVWFQPWQRPAIVDGLIAIDHVAGVDDVEGPSSGEHAPAPALEAVAHLVHTTGPIAYRPTSVSEWEQLDAAQLPVFGCPSDSSVRTAAGALAELKTPSGSRIRLNESSEVSFVSDEELELKQGQIWCRAAGDSPLRVVTSQGSAAPQTSDQIWTLACPTSSEIVTSCSPVQPLQVVSAAGHVEVSAYGQQQTLSAGTFATLTNGGLEIRQSEPDLVEAQRWMQPLLTLGGHGNPELVQRVDALLARLGRTKLAYLYEQDLRNLGEYGALPLLRFVESAASRQEPERRHKAVGILADTAPIWMVPDLIALLEDDDPALRIAAARGLTRLTGTDHGLSPELWEGDPVERTAAVSQWRQWWQQHRSACPAPPANVAPQWDQVH